MSVYINGPGHMTKMAAMRPMPIYGKTIKKSFSGTDGPILTKPGTLVHYSLYNHDLGLTLNYFMARSILVT